MNTYGGIDDYNKMREMEKDEATNQNIFAELERLKKQFDEIAEKQRLATILNSPEHAALLAENARLREALIQAEKDTLRLAAGMRNVHQQDMADIACKFAQAIGDALAASTRKEEGA